MQELVQHAVPSAIIGRVRTEILSSYPRSLLAVSRIGRHSGMQKDQ
jgi:hypothetical protein